VTVRVRFAPKSRGPQDGTLTINSNDPDEPIRTVGLQGVGVMPEISVDLDPSVLNFGTPTPIPIGVSGERTFNVINKSSDALLSVASIARSGSNRFSVLSPTGAFTVAAGVQQTVTVRFAPNNTALQKGTLTINSNDPNKPQLSVSLQGTGSRRLPLCLAARGWRRDPAL
jgi:hypothetical protein